MNFSILGWFIENINGGPPPPGDLACIHGHLIWANKYWSDVKLIQEKHEDKGEKEVRYLPSVLSEPNKSDVVITYPLSYLHYFDEWCYLE